MSAGAAVVAEIARRLVGGSIDVGDVVAKVKSELADELRELEARIEAKLLEQFAAIGLLVATDALVDSTEKVLDAFDPPAHGTIPKLGISVEIVTDLGEKFDATDVDTTGPEGSSER